MSRGSRAYRLGSWRDVPLKPGQPDARGIRSEGDEFRELGHAKGRQASHRRKCDLLRQRELEMNAGAMNSPSTAP
jgi:hypothetical protein